MAQDVVYFSVIKSSILAYSLYYYNKGLFDAQVYAPRIDDEHAITFERCSRYVFEVRGPRMDIICFLALKSNGSDGWKPETVRIYGPDYNSLVFSFDIFLPNDGYWFVVTSCKPRSESAFFSSVLFQSLWNY